MKKKSKKGKGDIKLIVDCNAIAYGALYSFGHLSYQQKPTGVIYGFLRKILDLAERFKTNDFFLCWDARYSHRHYDYPGYKQNREKFKEEMSPVDKKAFKSMLDQRGQLTYEILPDLGFKNNFIRDKYEADDLIGWWVDKLCKKNQVVVITSDNDIFQCLDRCDIFMPTNKKNIMFTQKDFEKKFGVKPSDWPMAKAIGGCGGDEVIGIEGIGDPKNPSSKALKYIRKELPKGVILSKILSKEGKETILRNLPIVTIPYKPELITPKMIIRRNKYDRKKFILYFDKFKFKSFLKDFKKWEKNFDLK